MNSYSDPEGSENPPREFRSVRTRRSKLLALAAFGGLLLLGLLGWPLITELLWGSLQGRAAGSPEETATATAIVPQIDETAIPTALLPAEIKEDVPAPETDSAIISLSEAGYSSLYAFNLQTSELARLSFGQWEDIHPALSPDGKRLAFASNRGGQWDLYVLGLEDGISRQISNDLSFNASPSWSPDGSWLAYEHYENQNLDIFIRPVDGSLEPVRISTNAGVDFSPAWSPTGQQIAFISDRSGSNQLWLVDLDNSGADRYRQLTVEGEHKNPAWSPDGRLIAWAAKEDGLWRIYVWDIREVQAGRRLIGTGEQPAWSQDGETILAVVRNPQEDYLTAYTVEGSLAMALVPLSGQAEGLSWATGLSREDLPVLFAEAGDESAYAWLQNAPENNEGRQELRPMNRVSTPYAQLNALALPYFDALRARTAQSLGWDLLTNLENVYIPLTVPLTPDRQQDWLYTGRAFSLHSALLGSGWLRVTREDFGGETYWRVYLRAAQQDGSFGRPMQDISWDFDARYGGTNEDYQSGGRLEERVASGYWLDFTQLAADFGWERLPALPNWRSYYQGALFDEFVLRQGMSWEEAMLQLYPTEVFVSQ